MEVDETIEIIETPSMKCELNTLSRSDGSCILSQNDNVMAVAIYGPVEVKLHKMFIDKASIEVIFKRQYGQSLGDRLYESIIGKICETAIITTFHPRTAIYVIIQEMQGSSDPLACCINATCLALIHAGVSMNYLFAAVTKTIKSENKSEVNSEEENQKSRITFVFENTSDKILAVDSCGKITDTEYKRCLESCRQTSASIFQFYKDMISKYAMKM